MDMVRSGDADSGGYDEADLDSSWKWKMALYTNMKDACSAKENGYLKELVSFLNNCSDRVSNPRRNRYLESSRKYLNDVRTSKAEYVSDLYRLPRLYLPGNFVWDEDPVTSLLPVHLPWLVFAENLFNRSLAAGGTRSDFFDFLEIFETLDVKREASNLFRM